MNPVSSNPYMLILEADPDRYLNRPAPTLLALLKVLEGVIAFLWCFRELDYLRQILGGRLSPGPVEALFSLLPGEVGRLVFPAGIPTGLKALGFVTALCVLVELLCLTVEAAASVLLRFGMRDTGAKCFKLTRRWTLIACVLLTFCVVLGCIPAIMSAVQGGFYVRLSALYPLIAQLVLVLLLALRIAYHRGALIVMKAIDYEIRLGFKETGMADHRLGLCSFLLGLLCLAAAAGLMLYARGRAVPACALLAVKFFAVWKSWNFFRRCHR